VSFYQQQKRKMPVQVLTAVGWITGTLHLPVKSRILEHLNHTRDFLALTDVRFSMNAEGAPIPFFAVQREAAILVIAPASEQYHTVTVEEMTVHPLSCLLELGTLDGRFKTLKGVRVSDYISSTKGFFLLEDCELALKDRYGRTLIEDRRSHVLLNVRHVIGVTEDQTGGV
jgi:hypothetical protein